MADRTPYILDRLPQFYNKDHKIINAIVGAISGELDLIDNQISVLNNIIGINTTDGDDLYTIWGKLLNIERKPDESDMIYRNRLKVSITKLNGGTKSALQYAAAVTIGINNDQVAMDEQITVTDAWLYTGPESDISKTYGNTVIVVDLKMAELDYIDQISEITQNVINITKASGVNVYLIFKNYRIFIYSGLGVLTYFNLVGVEYNKLGG